MSFALIWVALPISTFGSGMGTMVGSLFLEKANLSSTQTQCVISPSQQFAESFLAFCCVVKKYG